MTVFQQQFHFGGEMGRRGKSKSRSEPCLTLQSQKRRTHNWMCENSLQHIKRSNTGRKERRKEGGRAVASSFQHSRLETSQVYLKPSTAEIKIQTMKGMLRLNDGFESAQGAVTLLLVPASGTDTCRGTSSSLLTLLSSSTPGPCRPRSPQPLQAGTSTRDTLQG